MSSRTLDGFVNETKQQKNYKEALAIVKKLPITKSRYKILVGQKIENLKGECGALTSDYVYKKLMNAFYRLRGRVQISYEELRKLSPEIVATFGHVDAARQGLYEEYVLAISAPHGFKPPAVEQYISEEGRLVTSKESLGVKSVDATNGLVDLYLKQVNANSASSGGGSQDNEIKEIKEQLRRYAAGNRSLILVLTGTYFTRLLLNEIKVLIDELCPDTMLFTDRGDPNLKEYRDYLDENF